MKKECNSGSGKVKGAERKKFRIFFSKSVVYLKSYINFEEIIKAKHYENT
jgi:hypothetical protein